LISIESPGQTCTAAPLVLVHDWQPELEGVQADPPSSVAVLGRRTASTGDARIEARNSEEIHDFKDTIIAPTPTLEKAVDKPRRRFVHRRRHISRSAGSERGDECDAIDLPKFNTSNRKTSANERMPSSPPPSPHPITPAVYTTFAMRVNDFANYSVTASVLRYRIVVVITRCDFVKPGSVEHRVFSTIASPCHRT
jgi:hypothetical protein